MTMLKIENLHAKIEDGTEILKGLNLEIKPGEVHAIMGPNGSGKSTLASVIAGKEDYEVTEGDILFENEDLMELGPDERAHKGIFLSCQYPLKMTGIKVTKVFRTTSNETREAIGLEDMIVAEMLKLIRENADKLDIRKDFLSRSLIEGFSCGEKKSTEIFQMLMRNPKVAILD